ncbi:GNAT family N-acetyltransferase [Deinococcus sp.]|uniref:GNAT family N-acetyltransferase n=1 Tax=Deinococcus sp. TaxID=47478 RepID=UPI003CC69E1A
MKYSSDLADLDAAQMDGFFVGWPKAPGSATLLQVLRGSSHVWLAFDGSRLVGFLTAISGGVMNASLPLLEVLLEYQGRGIGSQLVGRMQATLHGLYALDVSCDEALMPFYQRHGFQ